MREVHLGPLHDLFCALFSSDELRRFIAYGPFGTQITRVLPSEGTPLATLVHALVEALERRGMIDPDLFRRLSAEFPARSGDIARVAESLSIAQIPSTAIAGAQRSPLFLVVTALPLESQAMLTLLSERDQKALRSGTVYETGVLRHQEHAVTVAVVQSGAGNLPAALLTMDATQSLNPRGLLFVGVAGGLKDVKLGDVVAGTRVYGYASGKDRQDFSPRPDVGQCAYRFEQRARAVANGQAWLRHRKPTLTAPPTVHVGPIAAGEVVVASTRSTTYRFLRKHYSDALAVEMEGRGFIAAAWTQHREALIVRGISDLINKKSHADAQGSQPLAAENAAAFAAEIMLNVRFDA